MFMMEIENLDLGVHIGNWPHVFSDVDSGFCLRRYSLR
ncbi:hypothetical protein Desgi_3662 [Desulfoscipio gibsoniae DSM 7213]|uniref:Uncharacterized protein n=1 Tax=Desulfoscipio gibsoniae DSM 7213 TaxID=767817 RepID=R4KQX6_9FIRM|nr:hypothetical protein Desgi_3662 [Desulfoscipio gibsoniae DSM 7213]